MKVLLIGWNPPLATDLAEDPDTVVHVLEEPSLLHEVPSGLPRLAARYQQDTGYREEAVALHQRERFDLVLPGREYGVPGAQWLSEHLGLPSVGGLAARASVDKAFLRGALAESGLPPVRSARITCRADLEDFFRGEPVVLKPANRHAAIGVVKVTAREGIAAAWESATGAGAGNGTHDRELEWRYVAEEWVPGEEFSVESLFSACPTCRACAAAAPCSAHAASHAPFHSVTEKTVVGGDRFTPMRHVVPAALPGAEREGLLAAQEELARALGVERGLLHAEWKLADGRCRLIEVSIRYPGGRLPLLIRHAHGINLARAWAGALLGHGAPEPPAAPHSAGVAFVPHRPGRFVRIEGLPTPEDPGVIASGWQARPGELLRPLDDAWARKGFVAVHGTSPAEVGILLDEHLSRVRVVVEGEDEDEGPQDGDAAGNGVGHAAGNAGPQHAAQPPM